jgi:hypothetical protein
LEFAAGFLLEAACVRIVLRKADSCKRSAAASEKVWEVGETRRVLVRGIYQPNTNPKRQRGAPPLGLAGVSGWRKSASGGNGGERDARPLRHSSGCAT